MRRLCTDSSRSYLGRSASRAGYVDGQVPDWFTPGYQGPSAVACCPLRVEETGSDTIRTRSAPSGNAWRDGAEVSRGHIRSGRTEGPNIATTWRSRADLGVPLNPTGCGIAGGERVPSHELYCDEPPTADPHGGWCGGRGLNTPGYPIRHLCHLFQLNNEYTRRQ